MTKCIHKSICNCFCNLIHKNAFEKHWHSYQHSTYSQTHYLLLFILISFCLWGSQNFFDTEIKEKVANEKNQKPMKQQNVWSMESCGGTCCGGGRVLGDVVRLLRLRPSAAVPLFARVICVNFDVWHRPPPPTAETRLTCREHNNFSNHQQTVKLLVNLLKTWSSLPLNKLSEGIWSLVSKVNFYSLIFKVAVMF